MKLVVNQRIFKGFAGVNIGVVVAKGVNNSGSSKEIEDLIRSQEQEIKDGFNSETLSENPKIKSWRDAYIKFGAKPKEHKSSDENLYRLILSGNNIRHINKLVDIYNLISLKYMMPVGGEDLDKIIGDIYLTFAKVNEPTVLLLGDPEPRVPHQGEVIYKDNLGAICRRWNWREADRSKLTESTKNAVLVIEGLLPVTKEEIAEATKKLKELVAKFCGGELTDYIIDSKHSKVEF